MANAPSLPCRPRQNDVSEILPRAIQRAYRCAPYPASMMALDAERTKSTAEKWACGQREPDVAAVLTMMKNNPTFRAAIMEALDEDVARFRGAFSAGVRGR